MHLSRRKCTWVLVACGVVLGLQLVSLQHSAWRVSSVADKRWPADPRLEWLDEDAPCSPQRHVAFLKTHKCASSSVQNIMFRYGEKYKLLFALPSHNYFGGGTRYVSKAMIDTELANKLGFDIYAVHSKWNMTEKWANMDLETYIRKVGPNGPRKMGYVGYNQMTWDLGLPALRFEDMEAVDELVSEADDLFDLVMVAERMPESLVLLRRLLCSEFEDVVVLQVNARREVVKKNGTLDQQTAALLQDRLAPDYKIYSHFYEKFDGLVERYGRDRMVRDLTRYDETSLARQETCVIKKVDGSKVSGISRLHKEKVIAYATNSTDAACQALVMPELTYFDKLRMDQTKTVLKRLQANGRANINMAAVHGGIPLPNFV